MVDNNECILTIMQGSLKQQSLRRGAINWFLFIVYPYKVLTGLNFG
jgi:hypothetical protein